MRTITGHHVNPANDRLTIEVLDEPGSGGAHHVYSISGFCADLSKIPKPTIEELEKILASEGSALVRLTTDGRIEGAEQSVLISFQNGPIAEAGANGITHEALLAILIDRLECFQRGPYACAENAQALSLVGHAQQTLLNRTRARMARGVEGTHAK